MLIRTLRYMMVNRTPVQSRTTIEVDKAEGQKLIDKGYAESGEDKDDKKKADADAKAKAAAEKAEKEAKAKAEEAAANKDK